LTAKQALDIKSIGGASNMSMRDFYQRGACVGVVIHIRTTPTNDGAHMQFSFGPVPSWMQEGGEKAF